MNIIRTCEGCGNEDSINCNSGLCVSCENKIEFEKLQEENESLRDSIDGYLPIDKAENLHTWKLINELIENELNQEKLCGK